MLRDVQLCLCAVSHVLSSVNMPGLTSTHIFTSFTSSYTTQRKFYEKLDDFKQKVMLHKEAG